MSAPDAAGSASAARTQAAERGRSVAAAMQRFAVVALLGGTAAAQASEALMEKSGCVSCHRVDQKLIGPPFKDVAAKYKGNKDALPYLLLKVRNGGEGVWGDIPMPPNSVERVSDADLKAIVEWILQL